METTSPTATITSTIFHPVLPKTTFILLLISGDFDRYSKKPTGQFHFSMACVYTPIKFFYEPG